MSDDDHPTHASGPAVLTDGLTKRFGGVTALDSLDLQIERGEVFGFLGPNGAGKSTTLRLLLGLIAPSAGRAEVMGVDVTRVREAHRHLAYVPGDVNLWAKLTGQECLELFANLHGDIDHAYRDELVDRFRLDTTKRARTYSKGNRQKVALVAAFATRAPLLLLDEPTSGLDPLMEEQFRRCVYEATERGQTIFLSSHLLSEVEVLCTRVGILREGALIEVASIDRLRALHTTTVEIELEAGTTVELPDLSAVPGVSSVSPLEHGVRVSLSGPPGPLLRAVASLPIAALRSEEASLEEIFLTYYGDAERA
jgi:ABC-2 type transport system ATP-binding protein